MTVRVYRLTDDSVRVLVANPKLRWDGETDVDLVARVAAEYEAQFPEVAGRGVDVDARTLPTDRDFRAAWTLTGAACTIDLPKAREVHRAHLRRARAPKLAELDASYLREMERGPQGRPQDISARKQVLRDLPQDPQIDAATSVADLRALWPTALLGSTPYVTAGATAP